MTIFTKFTKNMWRFLEFLKYNRNMSIHIIENKGEKIKLYIKILKPQGSLVDISIVLAVGGLLGEIDGRAISALICAVLIHSACDIYNDIYDLDIDRLAKPTSPLVTGAISNSAAWAYMGILLGVAFAIGYSLSTLFLLFSIIGFILGGIIYSHPFFRLKDRPFFSMFFTLGFGLEVLGVWSIYSTITQTAIVLSLHIFFTIFCLVSLKDYKDVKGDRSSIPLKFGISLAVKINTILAILPLFSFAILIKTVPSISTVLSFMAYCLFVTKCLKILWRDPIKKGKKLKSWMVYAILVPNVILSLNLIL